VKNKGYKMDMPIANQGHLSLDHQILLEVRIHSHVLCLPLMIFIMKSTEDVHCVSVDSA
jgi:hypothetical protein